MKVYTFTLIFRYGVIEAEIEAKSRKEATAIFWETVAENEGSEYARSAKEFGHLEVIV